MWYQKRGMSFTGRVFTHLRALVSMIFYVVTSHPHPLVILTAIAIEAMAQSKFREFSHENCMVDLSSSVSHYQRVMGNKSGNS